MNTTYRLLAASTLTACLVLPAASHAGWKDMLNNILGSETAQQAMETVISDEDIANGLKAALDKGVQAAVDKLGKPDGFLQQADVKIPLPSELQSVEKLLRKVGQDEMADTFITSINRAAEQAVPETVSVLADAVKKMTLEDAQGILKGGDNAATEYFRRTSEQALSDRILPIVKKNTAKAGVTGVYKDVMKQVGFLGGMLGISEDAVDIDQYVTGKAMDGLFLRIAEEEKRIREDPAARTTEILKKVFGY